MPENPQHLEQAQHQNQSGDIQSFDIRKAYSDEVTAIAQLVLAMAWESEQRQLDPKTLQNGIQAVFTNPALGTYWVVCQDGKLLGCTLITVEWSDWNNASYWWIQSLYITPEHRGKGVFQKLLSVLESAAMAEQVQEVRLYVERNNLRAIRAYEKSGFESEHYQCMTKPLAQ